MPPHLADGRCDYCGSSIMVKGRKRKPQPEPEPSLPLTLEMADDLLADAAAWVLETRQASVSMLQRKLAVGYTRAARLIDQLEDAGIVGPFRGSAARAVIPASREEAQRLFDQIPPR